MSITKASLIDLNGQELILDADADTSITADTDDQIDIKIAGSDSIRIKANEIENVSGSFTLDSASDIVLDADGGAIFFKDGGTEIGRLFNSASDLILKSAISDQDLKLQGNDGGSAINALILDMSEAGAATFNAGGVFNEVSADSDFRVESNGQTHALFVDAGNDAVGIFSSVPASYYANELVVLNADEGGITLAANATTHRNLLAFADGTSGDARYAGYIAYDHNTDAMSFHGGGVGTKYMEIDSAGQVSFSGTGGDDGYTIPFDQDTTYSNNLNAGAFSILHRNAYDSYIVGNAYYYKTGGSAGWRVKYGGYNSNVISMVNGRINFQATAGTVAGNGDALNGLATRASIDSDGLKFGTDTAAANALDDYEESSFNTELVGTTSGTHTTSGSGRMTKIGRLASVLLAVDNVSSSSVSGDLRINLPIAYAGHDIYLPVQVYYLNYPADTKTAYAYVSNGYTYVLLYWSRDNNTSLAINSSDLLGIGGSYIRAAFSYPTA